MRFLILLLVFCWVAALLRRSLVWLLGDVANRRQPASRDQARAQSQAPGTAIARRLVRDPVCGVHVAESRAIPLREGTELLHFCSTGCRDNYVATEKKLAANG